MNIETIMVVDDSQVAQMVTENVIEEFDPSIEILQAYDGDEALTMLDKLEIQPNIILLDINMPRMNGFEFLDEYSKREHKSNIIAMHTSSDDERDRKKAAQYDIVKTYFTKPLEASDLENIKNL